MRAAAIRLVRAVRHRMRAAAMATAPAFLQIKGRFDE
jgi:hypothetical protein